VRSDSEGQVEVVQREQKVASSRCPSTCSLLPSPLLFDEVYRHGELLALKRSGTCFVLMTPAMPTVRDRTDTNANDIEDARFKGWSACAAAMRSHDEDMVKNWKEEIDTLLLLVCY
jgi:hypothetical protein